MSIILTNITADGKNVFIASDKRVVNPRTKEVCADEFQKVHEIQPNLYFAGNGSVNVIKTVKENIKGINSIQNQIKYLSGVEVESVEENGQTFGDCIFVLCGILPDDGKPFIFLRCTKTKSNAFYREPNITAIVTPELELAKELYSFFGKELKKTGALEDTIIKTLNLGNEKNYAIGSTFDIYSTSTKIKAVANDLMLLSGAFVIGSPEDGEVGGISAEGSDPEEVGFWLGSTYADRATAPFRVLRDGSFYATKINIKSSGTGKRIEIDNDDNNIKLIKADNSVALLIDDDAAIVGYTLVPFPGSGVVPVYGPGIMIGEIAGNYLSLSAGGINTNKGIGAKNIYVEEEVSASYLMTKCASTSGDLPSVGLVLATGNCALYTYPNDGQIQRVKNNTGSAINIDAADSPGRNILTKSNTSVFTLSLASGAVQAFQYYQSTNVWVML